MFSKSSVGGFAAGFDSSSAIFALSSSISLLSSTSFSVGCGSAGSSTCCRSGARVGVGSSTGTDSSIEPGAGIYSSIFAT